MAASGRYTGKDSVILFGGTVISNDYTELSVEHSIRVEEKTAGSELDASYNSTIREGKGSLKVYDTAPNDSGLKTLLAVGARAILEVRIKGSGTGKPAESWYAIVTSMKSTIAFDKNTVLEIELIKDGAFIVAPGGLQA